MSDKLNALRRATEALRTVEGAAVEAAAKVGRVFVRDLAGYASGKSRGAWITPTSDAEENDRLVRGVLGEEVDEWAVHDYDDFPDLGETPGAETLASVVELIEEHGSDAVGAALSYYGGHDVDHARKVLNEGFREYDEPQEKALELYAEELAEEGVLSKDHLLQYVDFEAVGRDLDLGGDVNAVEHKGKTFIFQRT